MFTMRLLRFFGSKFNRTYSFRYQHRPREFIFKSVNVRAMSLGGRLLVEKNGSDYMSTDLTSSINRSWQTSVYYINIRRMMGQGTHLIDGMCVLSR